MATISVLDATGSTQTVEKPNANGRAAATASRPVALSTEDKASLDAVSTALAGSLTVNIGSGPFAVTGAFYPATQPISVASLPLPTGAATAAGQDAIATAIGGIAAGGDASAANQDEQTALLTSIDTRLGAATYYPATQPVSGTVSISGSVAVTGTFWQATQPVSLASLPSLAAGANVIGGVTQSGTWNIGSVATLPALVASTAIIGKVGIDQTSDGTTNKVNIDASLKSGTATRTTVNSGTASATILAANANRKGATIFNSDANALLLDLSGGTAAATRCQVRLTQYQNYEVGSGYTGAITGIWEADGSGSADVVEFT